MSDELDLVLEVLPLVRKVYERHWAGCCLHILLDDGDWSDKGAEDCLRTARESENHIRPEDKEECIELAEKLLLMTATQRRRLMTMKWE